MLITFPSPAITCLIYCQPANFTVSPPRAAVQSQRTSVRSSKERLGTQMPFRSKFDREPNNVKKLLWL